MTIPVRKELVADAFITDEPTAYVDAMLAKLKVVDGYPRITEEFLHKIPLNYVGNIRICKGFRIRFRSDSSSIGFWEMSSIREPKFGLPSWPMTSLEEALERRNEIYANHFRSHKYHFPSSDAPVEPVSTIASPHLAFHDNLAQIMYAMGTLLQATALELDPTMTRMTAPQRRTALASIKHTMLKAIHNMDVEQAYRKIEEADETEFFIPKRRPRRDADDSDSILSSIGGDLTKD